MVPSLVFESMTCGRHWQDPAASGTGKVQHRDPLLQRGLLISCPLHGIIVIPTKVTTLRLVRSYC